MYYHDIIPKTIKKDVRDVIEISSKADTERKTAPKKRMTEQEKLKLIETMTVEMKNAAKMLEFEHAAFLRDKIRELKGTLKKQ